MKFYLGDFGQAAILMRQAITIETSSQAGDTFAKNQTLIRALARVDVAVFRPAAFCVVTGVKTA